MRVTLCLLLSILLPLGASAGQAPVSGGVGAVKPGDHPLPPVPPATINRDASGQATVRAVRLTSPLRIDGRLDEAIYGDVPPMSDFIQQEPKEGAPATEKTDAWVFFDDTNLYVVCRCWESDPAKIVANEMRRDNQNLVSNDQFGWSIDTFHDRRNGMIFEVGAGGGRTDGQVSNERQFSFDWNPIWEVKTARFEGGYVVEAALPFKSIRYRPGVEQVWGIQMRRRNMAKNEYSYLNPVPASVGMGGHFRVSLAATLVGIEAPSGSRNLDIKPYATASLTTDKAARPAVNGDTGGDIGVDVKYGVTQSLTADFTVNTDFAQVEADEQQVNLTRFNLFFPEKRDFFLENSGIFSFGAATTMAGAAGETPLLFHSRTIGLYQGREVPIRAGARLSGRAGPFTIGALNVQSGDDALSAAEATNFTVVRLRRDVLNRSNVGVIATNRTVGADGLGASQSYGADGSFSFGSDLIFNGYWAQTRTENVASGDDTSYRAYVDYDADRFGVQFDHLMVGRQFDPQLGFLRRRDMSKNAGVLRFSPRPKDSRRIRRYTYQATLNFIDNATTGQPESKSVEGRFAIDLQNSDVLTATYTDRYEFLPAPFRIAPDVTLPVGGYDFGSGKLSYNFGRQRRLSGNLALEKGTFYDGNITTWSATSGRLNVAPRFSLEPSVSINQVDVSTGEFTTKLVTTRATFTMTPLMFVSALLQFNSGSNTFATNVRFRWEYSPGSELFVVYNDQRDTLGRSYPDLVNRAVVLKINRVTRF